MGDRFIEAPQGGMKQQKQELVHSQPLSMVIGGTLIIVVGISFYNMASNVEYWGLKRKRDG